jgi:hypothetical protein
MRRAPLTRALTVVTVVLGLVTLSPSAAYADDTSIGLPSIDLSFTAESGIHGSQEWCATGKASSEAVAPTWTVTFAGVRAGGLPYRSGPHVFTLPSMSICGVMSKDGALSGSMTATVTYVGAVGSTPLATTVESVWVLDDDYFLDWHN